MFRLRSSKDLNPAQIGLANFLNWVGVLLHAQETPSPFSNHPDKRNNPLLIKDTISPSKRGLERTKGGISLL
jgi:hypothetical protein